MDKTIGLKRYSEIKKKGCPTCGGVSPKSCMRCQGKTRMCDWFYTDKGMTHLSKIVVDALRK